MCWYAISWDTCKLFREPQVSVENVVGYFKNDENFEFDTPPLFHKDKNKIFYSALILFDEIHDFDSNVCNCEISNDLLHFDFTLLVELKSIENSWFF